MVRLARAVIFLLLTGTSVQAQYYGPYGPPRGWAPLGPPQRGYEGLTPGMPPWVYPGGRRGYYDDGGNEFYFRRYYDPPFRNADPYLDRRPFVPRYLPPPDYR